MRKDDAGEPARPLPEADSRGDDSGCQVDVEKPSRLPLARLDPEAGVDRHERADDEIAGLRDVARPEMERDGREATFLDACRPDLKMPVERLGEEELRYHRDAAEDD